MSQGIKIKTAQEIEKLRRAGSILSGIIKEVTGSLTKGMTTRQLDALAEQLIAERQVIPAFKGYRGFPACLCISINQEVVHGIPDDRVIQEGDLVSIDAGLIHDEYYADMAVTVGVGKISPACQRLIDVTRDSLKKGIQCVRPGAHLSDISHAIQSWVEAKGFSVVRDFVGHGIGRNLHEEPEIPNFGPPHQGPILKKGMVLAIEPMINVGGWQTRILENGWTVVTLDGKLSAHFEHTVAVTSNGSEILTQ